jgi:uncharacterized membrane protein YjgN (DUF898 family)
MTPSVYRLEFRGKGSSFFLIFLKNVFLSLITFGVYLAWAKVDRRRYVWNNFSFHDQPFRYTGKGLELFKGYLVVVAAYSLFLLVPPVVSRASPAAGTVLQFALILTYGAVVPFLIYRSRAFLYNRTVWRGIRFGLAPRSKQFAKTFWAGMLLTILTLGCYSPIMRNRLHRIVTENTRFGTLEFHYTGVDREAFWLGMKGITLSLLTLGIYSFWYSAELTRYQLGHTRVGDDATLRSELTGGDLFGLFLLAILGTTLTLGLAFPWITMYSIDLIARRTSVVGEIDFDAIEQRSREEGATADGFADAFDLDLGL